MSKGLTTGKPRTKEFAPFKASQNYPRELYPSAKLSSDDFQIYLNKGSLTLEEDEAVERCKKCGKKKEIVNEGRALILVKGQDTQTAPLEEVLSDMQSTCGTSDMNYIKNIPFISVVINEVTTCDTPPQTLPYRTNVSDDERWIQRHENLSGVSSLNGESQTLTIQELQSENSKEITVPIRKGTCSKIGSILSFAILATISLFSLLELDKLNPAISYANGTFMVFAIYSLMGIWASYVESKEDQHEIPGAYVKALVSQTATAVPFLAVEVWLEFFKNDMIHQYAGHIYAGACAVPLFLYPVAGFNGVKRMLSVMVALGLGALTALFLMQDNHVGLAAVIAYSASFLCQGDDSSCINSRKQTFVNICNCAFLCFTLVTLEELYTKSTIMEKDMMRIHLR